MPMIITNISSLQSSVLVFFVVRQTKANMFESIVWYYIARIKNQLIMSNMIYWPTIREKVRMALSIEMDHFDQKWNR